MTAKQVQQRRDTQSNLLLSTPAVGELGINTTAKRIHLGDGLTAGGIPHANYIDVQQGTFDFVTAGGTGNAITLTPTYPLLGYTNAKFTMKATANNTGAVTVNISGLGNKNALKMAGGTLTALEADDIVSGGVYQIFYDGTQFQIKSLDETPESQAGSTLIAVASGGGSSYDFTSGIDSTYSDYLFVLENVLTSNNNSSLLMQCRRAGQGSFDSGSSDYEYMICQARRTSGTVISSSPSHASGSSILLASNVASGGTGVSGRILGAGLPNSGESLFECSLGCKTYWASGSTGVDPSTSIVTGSRETSTALDGVRFVYSGGNISGNIYMYGLDKSL